MAACGTGRPAWRTATLWTARPGRRRRAWEPPTQPTSCAGRRHGTDDRACQLLPGRGWRADLPPPGALLLPQGGGRSGAARGLPQRGPRAGRGAPAALPDSVLGRATDVRRAARTSPAAHAARAFFHRGSGAGRLAAPYAGRSRRDRPRRALRHAVVELPGDGRAQPGQPAVRPGPAARPRP